MAEKTFEEVRKEFLSLFGQIARYKHRYDVFRDFVTMSAITLRNAMVMNQTLEDEYLSIIKGYEKDDQQQFPKLLALLVDMLEFEPSDVLGNLFGVLELTSKEKGQFFTPQPISELMASIVGSEEISLGDKPFITLSEPACGAGGMVLAFVKQMQRSGHNPAERLWVQAIDVDRLAALMCYVQLSLWHVPAEVIVGNTLSLEVREVWDTPAHILGNWPYKLRIQAEEQASEPNAKREPEPSMASDNSPNETPVADDLKKPFGTSVQFDFGF
jgi:type I restriction-modification system DNA methylase subunit